MYCLNCSAEYGAGIKFCVQCGELLAAGASCSAVVNGKPCGGELLPSYAACGNCGTVVSGKRVRPRRPERDLPVDAHGNYIVHVPKGTPLSAAIVNATKLATAPTLASLAAPKSG